MKVIQGSLFRAIVAIVVGVLLIKYRMDALHWLTVAVGGLFFLSGAVSCLVYWHERRRARKLMEAYQNGEGERPRMPFLPIVGVGSLILGGILATMADTFNNGVAYVLAGILILGALNQLINLGQARRYNSFAWFYWVLPLVTLLVGFFILVKPMEALATPLLVIGWCMAFYGVVEALNALKLHHMRRAYEKAEEARIVKGMQMAGDVEDAEIVEESEAKDEAK